MAQRIFITLIALVAMMLTTVPVYAGNPHFIKNASSCSLSGVNLVCDFKEAGLQSGSTATVRVDFTATTTYECVNNGGRNPSAANKTTTVANGFVQGEFTADQNGNIVGELTVSPPSASALGFSCPSGQEVTFVSVTYSNVTITDLDSGASLPIPGTFSYTNPSAP